MVGCIMAKERFIMMRNALLRDFKGSFIKVLLKGMERNFTIILQMI